MEWYLMVWQKYAQFDGRSQRREYWMFLLFNMVIYCVLYAVSLLMFTQRSSLGFVLLAVCGIYGLAGLIPGIAVSIRRLHDTNKSGWWILISLIPLVGGIILLVLMAMDGDPGPNLYGPSPKMIAQPV